MSVEQLAVVLHHSQAKGSDKLVLLGIANHAGDGGAWPAISTLARYANLSERSTQYAITRLVDSGELTRYVQGGGLVGWADFTRPNRYDVTVVCPEWCDRSPHHRPLPGWTFDRELREVVRVEISTGDTPGTQKPATRRKDRVQPTAPGAAHCTPPVQPTAPEPSLNQPDPNQVSASTTDAPAVPADDVDLSTVRDRLREATEQHDRRERGNRA